MIKTILFSLCIAFAVAQTVTDLVGSQTVTGTLLPVLSSSAAERSLVYYRYWVPDNITYLSFTFTQLNQNSCPGDVRYYISAAHVPCGNKWSEPSNTDYPCREGATAYFNTPQNKTLFPDPDSSIDFKLNSWVYISLGRDVTSDYADTCTFTITPNPVFCPAGQVGVDESGSACANVSPIVAPYVANWDTTATEAYYKIAVPFGTAFVHVYVNNTGSSGTTYVYGNPFFPGSDNTYYCYDSSSSNGNGDYEVNLYCFNVPAGDFYLYVETTSTTVGIRGNVSITTQVCSGALGGYNCTFQAINVTAQTSFSESYTINAQAGTSTAFDDSFKYFYINAPAGSTAAANFTALLNADSSTSSYFYYRTNAYTATSSQYYDFWNSMSATTPQTVALQWHDFYVGSVIVMGISNEGTTGTVNFTLSSSTLAPSTTGIATTGLPSATTAAAATTGVPVGTTGAGVTTGIPVGTTGMAVTTGTTDTPSDSAGSAIVVSFGLLLAAFFAML